MSGEDDDDEIWNSDNFIATIEVFLQKAEQESAVKHGTQSVVPSASSSIPATSVSTYSNGPFSKFGPSSADSKLPYGSSVFRGGVSGRMGDFPAIGPEHRVDESAGRPLMLQPLNYRNPWASSDVKAVHTSQQSKGLVEIHTDNLQLAMVENESQALMDMLVEKDGAISLLRTRLREAEQQVDELRRKGTSHTALQPAISQQRELERLSSQLLFKEHEMSELQRLRLEEEKKLKDALGEATVLRRELEHLKQSRLTGTDGPKRSRDEGSSPLDLNVERHATITSRPHGSVEKNIRPSEQQLDPWTSPWVPERTVNIAQRKASHGGHEKNVAGLSNRHPVGDLSPAVATLKRRTAENGCVSSSKSETNDCKEPKAIEAPGQSREPEAALSELSYSLQQIWGFKGAKNDGKDLVGKIYAACAHDLYTLLSNGDDNKAVDCKSSDRRKSESLTLSEKFYSAVAKVTSGAAHPEIILGPLLEFCNLDNAKLLGSALRVLHCILQHDVTCRKRLMWRRKRSHDAGSPLLPDSHLEGKDSGEEAKCGFRVVSKTLANGESKQLPVFFSPRIILQTKEPEVSGSGKGNALDKLKRHAGTDFPLEKDRKQLQELQTGQEDREEQGFVEGVAATKDPSAKVAGDPCSHNQSTALQELEHGLGGVRGTKSINEELDPFLKWMLHLALASTSAVVRMEAVAIIGVLVVHSEPLVGRLLYGPLLSHEGLELLLKESAGVEIQLQAVRIVHHLLHCPALYRKFCYGTTEEQSNSKPENYIDPKMVMEESTVVEGNNLGNSSDHKVDAHVAGKGLIPRPSAGLMKRKLLAGLADCLKFTGISPQGYALRRNVMRLITFIASCGDAGVAFLTQPVASRKTGADEPSRTCRDDQKTDGMALGDSASGQHIAGDVSGLKGLDPRGRMNSGTDDVEAGLAENREDLETVINFPEKLVTLLGAELEIRDEEETDASLVEERACLIREVATLLSCLASHPVQSGVVLGFLTSSQKIARLTLSVVNDIVNRKPFRASATGQKYASLSNSDTSELCKSLRRRVLRAMAESSEPH
ncbi:hypothetical protein MPTK1_6g09940 [Marchantia polymorpha subsp. ruderalis]|uniref:Uncharacterized protein n=2 Tax=Marchantia polymorpha TaxID=3197 RepID=A0AAF6BQE7_MARPO|nr:hypothetical protein MARPO_0016s0037 [Marchantia polymorpha]BBN14231.1 hypothetical protein Mp_6g09940 [Marchantia polymorpha subsp. ruderalis]|eukprot:PTQ44968.1 hypothetical protein MARPO_0016s0037 [Marchantia polymorpha]